MPEFDLEERKSFIQHRDRRIRGQLHEVELCFENCRRTIQEIESMLYEEEELRQRRLEEVALADIMMSLRNRVGDIIEFRHAKLLSDSAETDFGEQVWNLSDKKFRPMWHGHSPTTADLITSHKQKRIMVQDKATRTNSCKIAKSDVRKLLQDSLIYGYYPSLCLSFQSDNEFAHFVIPVEEVMSLIRAESLTLSRKKLDNGDIRSLSIEEFVDGVLECQFPSMKFDEKQFEAWLNRLD